MDFIIFVAKTKAPISFICVFVFAYAKSRFSHDAAQINIYTLNTADRGQMFLCMENRMISI